MRSVGLVKEGADLPLVEVVGEAGLQTTLPQLLQEEFQVGSEFLGVAQSPPLQVLLDAWRSHLPECDLSQVVPRSRQILFRVLMIDLSEPEFSEFSLSGVVFVGSVEDKVQDAFGGAVTGLEGFPQLSRYLFNVESIGRGQGKLNQAAEGHAEVFLVVVEGRGVGFLAPPADIIHQLIMRVIHNVADRLFGAQAAHRLGKRGLRGIFLKVRVVG